MVRVTSTVNLSGPFFERDPAGRLKANFADMMAVVAAEMERDVAAQISARRGSMPGWSGFALSRVVGRTKALDGKPWALTAVVSLNYQGLSAADARRLMAEGAGRHTPRSIRPNGTTLGIEQRWHPFRRTARSTRAAIKAQTVNLTKGLE